MDSRADVSIDAKVEYLRQPDSYPDSPDRVEVIETHFAWVFLTPSRVYKLKKPVSLPELNLTTLAARRNNCELELTLNRRLAKETYLAIVALTRCGSSLALGGDSDVVDWLVEMRRLPSDVTLESELPSITTDDARLARVLQTLCEFYKRTEVSPWTASAYIQLVMRQCRLWAQRLMRAELASEHARVRNLTAKQLDFVQKHVSQLAKRIERARVREVHGDLRPEHIFLLERPQIIDCLEFSSELRQLDTLEEISFLALECERLGRSDIAQQVCALYAKFCRDAVAEGLYLFYRSRRALARAFLSLWHIDEVPDADRIRHWIDQTLWYLSVAEASIDRAVTLDE